MRVIFVYFDGVLNTENYQAQLRDAGVPCWDDFGHVFDPEAVENLKMVLEAVPDFLPDQNSHLVLTNPKTEDAVRAIGILK